MMGKQDGVTISRSKTLLGDPDVFLSDAVVDEDQMASDFVRICVGFHIFA